MRIRNTEKYVCCRNFYHTSYGRAACAVDVGLSVQTPALRDKKLSYRRGTARCVVSDEILPIATQRCRNCLYDKS